MSKFHLIDRDIDFLLPPSVHEWLPEGHLARYVVELVEWLDVSDLERAYAGEMNTPHFSERFSEPPEPTAEATPVQRMTHRLKTGAGKAAYALRKSTVEPVFGIIKSVMGFRQFLTRGLANVQGEWTLVCLAWNLKRMAVLRPQ